MRVCVRACVRAVVRARPCASLWDEACARARGAGWECLRSLGGARGKIGLAVGVCRGGCAPQFVRDSGLVRAGGGRVGRSTLRARDRVQSLFKFKY